MNVVLDQGAEVWPMNEVSQGPQFSNNTTRDQGNIVWSKTIPDKGWRGNQEVFARFWLVSELSKSSRNRIPCDFVRQYLVSQARLSREGAET